MNLYLNKGFNNSVYEYVDKFVMNAIKMFILNIAI